MDKFFVAAVAEDSDPDAIMIANHSNLQFSTRVVKTFIKIIVKLLEVYVAVGLIVMGSLLLRLFIYYY